MRKICLITGSRAEYGLLYWLMKDLAAEADVELQVIVTGMHLMPQFGLTSQLIEEDGFSIRKKIPLPMESDGTLDVAKAVGVGVEKFAEAFHELKPDIVVILGDRYEVFAAATAATLTKTPIAHIHGGEVTEGAFDDAFRHAITKMSYLHFAAAETYRKRIIQMGEAPERVFNVGALGLEHIKRTALLSKVELESSIDFEFGSPSFLITYHPVTLEEKSSAKNLAELLQALDAFPQAKLIFTQSNADPDHGPIRRLINEKVKDAKGRAVVFDSLGYKRYLSALQYVDLVIGNSSSGLIEVPAFHKPTINLGDRQKGRLLASSVINCKEESADIISAIQQALSPEFQRGLANVNHPYHSEASSLQIRQILKTFPLHEGCLKKQFYDL